MITKCKLIVAIAALMAGVLSGCTPPTTGGGGTDFTQCPTRNAGEVRVAVVVDATSAGGTAAAVCVVVANGATGITALYARAARLGTTPPRFAANGLLCAIDGAPAAPACGDPNSGGFSYWSYWTGGSTWTYAPIGPASRSLQDGNVEGWRFQTGGTQPPPALPSTFAQLVA